MTLQMNSPIQIAYHSQNDMVTNIVHPRVFLLSSYHKHYFSHWYMVFFPSPNRFWILVNNYLLQLNRDGFVKSTYAFGEIQFITMTNYKIFFSNPKLAIHFLYSVHKLSDQNKSVASHICRKHYQQNDAGNCMLHGSMFKCIL